MRYVTLKHYQQPDFYKKYDLLGKLLLTDNKVLSSYFAFNI